MLRLKVSGITCGGCAAAIKRALGSAVPGARVDVDVPTGIVEVDTQATARDKIVAAIEEAGFIVTGEAA